MSVVPFVLDVGVPLAQALWARRNEIPGWIDQTGALASHVVEHGGLAVHRIGSAIVFGDGTGGQQVLAFIESTGQQLGQIQNAINGVSATQAAISTSLGFVQQLSMLTLGVSVMSPLVLLTQNKYLSSQIKSLAAQVNEIKQLLTDEQVNQLYTGIHTLENVLAGGQSNPHLSPLLPNAVRDLTLSAIRFDGNIRDAIKAKKPHAGVRLLARNLAVATCGIARCYVQLGEDATARKEIEKRTDALREATRYIFQQTAGKETERFLIPELGKKVLLVDLVEIFEQASLAGVLDETNKLQAQLHEKATSDVFFESIRDRLFRGNWWPTGPRPESLLAELQVAMGAVEELNRVLGLELFLAKLASRDEKAAGVLDDVETRKTKFAKDGDPFIGWVMT